MYQHYKKLNYSQGKLSLQNLAVIQDDTLYIYVSTLRKF